MRKLILLLLFTSLSLPARANKRITVEQLERLLLANRGKSDEKIAQQLFGLEITERLSTAKLSRWESILPGPESRRSLLILADMSAFLDPPAAEIPATATPDLASQQQIMALAVSYAAKTISKLPNFLATRDTIFFEDTPTISKADSSVIPYQPLHPVSRSSEAVVYRDGREVVDSSNAKHRKQDSAAHGLTTWGVFGPILGTVLVDVSQGRLVWSHWEQAASGPAAVFHFQVSKEKSHYEVSFCCVAGDGNAVFKQKSGYSGEIAVDPVTGTILRLTLKADLKSPDPLLRSDIMVEYGSVEIAGQSYICPIKSVSVTIVPTLPPLSGEMTRYRGLLLDTDKHAAMEHLQTLLNDVAFANYHLFRAESRILTGDGASTDQSSPGIAAEQIGVSAAPISNANQSENTTSQTTVAIAPTADSTASPTTEPAAPDTPLSEGRRPDPTNISPIPEISVATPTSLQADITGPTLPLGTGFTMRVTSRLVDVGVVAFDKKGRPVTDLSSDNFEIYDNGRKQTVRIFSRTGELTPQELSAEQKKPGAEAEEQVYSNRQPNIVDTNPQKGAKGSGITLLLIDSSSLAWPDLNYARDEMLRFLQKLQPTDRVGLYERSSSRFNVLVEPSADHALIALKLHRWMPTARDLAQAREMEQRNRQQIDEVLHQEDLQYVNGNVDTPAETTTMVDPQLRDYGSNPGRSALSVLVSVARHLAAFPGHKNLIWVASDNVLADWQDNAVGTDEGNKHVDSFVLRAQEALNDSQVSVYPLDASQLETMATDSSLANSSVQLSPSVTVLPGETPQSGVSGPGLGRTAAEMQQDIHPIQGAFQLLAESTGGRVFRRSSSIAANLNSAVEDGRSVYLLGFAPDTQADDKYHSLTVRLSGKRGVKLRYRTGYLYTREPATLKERFQQAVWQPHDMSEIAISARFIPASKGTTLKLNIATNDLALKQQGENWTDKLDVFLVRRDEMGRNAHITEQTLRLILKSSTYARLFQEGVPFDQFIEDPRQSESVRIIVIDENSGSMGSITISSSALQSSP